FDIAKFTSRFSLGVKWKLWSTGSMFRTWKVCPTRTPMTYGSSMQPTAVRTGGSTRGGPEKGFTLTWSTTTSTFASPPSEITTKWPVVAGPVRKALQSGPNGIGISGFGVPRKKTRPLNPSNSFSFAPDNSGRPSLVEPTFTNGGGGGSAGGAGTAAIVVSATLGAGAPGGGSGSAAAGGLGR